MFNVDNKKTISNLAKKSFKANKLRNIFAIIAIVLTAVLFTSLFTVFSSLMESMQQSTMRQVGGNSHGTFKYLSGEEYDRLKTHKSIKEIGYSICLGNAENRELLKRPSEIRYTSGEWQAKSFFDYPETGRLPLSGKELATDTIVLDKLGIKHEVGQKINIEYSLNNRKIVDTFTLVGFWEGDKVIPASMIWLSEDYVQDKLKSYVSLQDDDPIGTINADVLFSNSFNIDAKMQKVITESGYGVDDIPYGVNWAYLGNSGDTDFFTVLGISGMVFLIIFCGYLIISNIFYISIAKDIQYYGLLKAIGTTSKQIKVIIRKQAGFLCLVGIPIGLLAGFLVGKELTPIILSILNTDIIAISFNPLIFIGAALFSILTVFISTNKPCKIAGKVSPIEAIRKTDSSENTKRKIRKSSKTGIFSMAQANVFRNRKKIILVTVSLSLSLIILNCSYSIVNSFDMDKYLQHSIINDFAVADAGYFNVYVQYSGQDTLSDEFLKELYSQNGAKETGNIYFSELAYKIDDKLRTAFETAKKEMEFRDKDIEFFEENFSQGTTMSHLYGIDSSILNNMEVFEGKINAEKFKTGKYVLASPFDSKGKISYYKVGDKVTLKFDGKKKEYEVMAVASIPFPISARHSHILDPNFIVPSNEFLAQKGKIQPMITSFEASDESIEKIESYLSDYCKNVNPDMHFESKNTFIKEFEGLKRTFLSVGLVISFIVAFIGIMNFINTIITSIIARKHELAMLQSIGMTKKQMKKMLSCEGIIYIGLTMLFVLTVGTILGEIGIVAFMGGIWFFKPEFTVIPSIICLPILFVLAMAVPLISYKFTGSKSIVEQLREAE